ncbi:MAG: tetratricopeptide repeat protein [Chitinispirillaceae bacterium]|nr:tetratricopeptide repeat protein [Chitinispirillaceae bacterium]
MTVSTIRKDPLFYAVLFTAWSLILFIRHADHHYFDTPFPSSGLERMRGGMSKMSLLRNSLTELQKNLIEEKNKSEKPHILQNIGCAYYDLYKESGDRTLLDSALTFTYHSTVERPGIGRFHYNLGRMFTELGDQKRALQQYELAIRCEPTHILALSNAGTCAYFAFNERKAAASYFGRALAIDSLMPMCNVILGLISLDEKDRHSARINFEKEIAACAHATVHNKYPLTIESLNYAASLAHGHLMTLYSTAFPDRNRAREHRDAYLKLEPEQAKRDEIVKEFGRYWGR